MNIVELHNGTQSLLMSADIFASLLTLARYGGWYPEYTTMHEMPEWEGDYLPACGQLISTTDAQKISAALTVMSDHLPNKPVAQPRDVHDFWSGEQEMLTQYADFFSSGSCTILALHAMPR